MLLKLFAFAALPVCLLAQADNGEIRITVKDPAGLALPSRVELISQANQYVRSFDSKDAGQIVARRLPFGRYLLSVTSPGFSQASQLIDIHTTIPLEITVALAIGRLQTTIIVNSDSTLVNPQDVSSAGKIGTATLRDRLTAQPGRSIAELVNQQPGWMFEANGILHPRAEEYQTQYVVDGLPLTDNRSAAFVPDFDSNDVQEMTVYTAGFPAEYGRKMGGVIELETHRDPRQGFHGKAVLSGGSFDTAGGYMEGQYGWGKNTLALSAAATTTDRFLDPPTLQNYTNHGAFVDFMAHYERDLTDKDRIGMILRREQSKFLVPNEILQQQSGQRQDRNSFESAAQFSYQHVFSSNVLGDFRAMTRDITAGFWSNDLATPMIVSQDRGYHETYVKGSISVHAGVNEFKAGVESDYASIEEALAYRITDPAQFDPDTPQTFNFYGRSPDREQAAFGQDQLHWKNVTLSAGIRFDHYQLVVNQTAWSPRLGLAVYWPWAKILFRGSYDRIFQTPPFENILLSSSPAINSLSDQVLRLPVEPARGNYYQAGFGRVFFGKVKLDSNFFWRRYHNYPDDDLLLNTGVSFPITFALANIYGVETKLEIPRWGPFSGYASWTNLRGNGYFPVTGGLFIGDDANQAISANSGVFPVSQEQRNTLRARFRYDVTSRVWLAMGATYDTGLPIDFEGTYQEAVAQYGQAIVNRINFGNFRPYPLGSLNASLGVLLRKRENQSIRFQIDGKNLTDEINVIDFDGLFSGTALGPPRSVNARLQFQF